MKRNNLPEAPYNGKAYAYIAIGLTVLAAVFFGLVFTKLGIYALIASVLLSIGAVTFANVQKRKNNFPQLKIIIICAYVVLILGAALFVGGIIWSGVK